MDFNDAIRGLASSLEGDILSPSKVQGRLHVLYYLKPDKLPSGFITGTDDETTIKTVLKIVSQLDHDGPNRVVQTSSHSVPRSNQRDTLTGDRQSAALDLTITYMIRDDLVQTVAAFRKMKSSTNGEITLLDDVPCWRFLVYPSDTSVTHTAVDRLSTSQSGASM